MKRPKMANSQKRAPGSSPNVRFEGTVHATRSIKRKDWANSLDVDRVPDSKGRIKAILSIDDCVRLLAEGFELRLHRAQQIGPLDRSLIVTDKAFKKWIDGQLSGMKDKPMPEPFAETRDT